MIVRKSNCYYEHQLFERFEKKPEFAVTDLKTFYANTGPKCRIKNEVYSIQKKKQQKLKTKHFNSKQVGNSSIRRSSKAQKRKAFRKS